MKLNQKNLYLVKGTFKMNKTKYLNITSLMLQIFVIALLFLDGVFVFDGWSEASFYYVYSSYGDRINNTPATLFMATIIAMIILSILQLTSNKVYNLDIL